MTKKKVVFEKEAEEYAKKRAKELWINKCNLAYPAMERAYRKGAEFGFQEGIKAKINTTTISDCPIKDEWHYVKDGELPADNKEVLVYMWDSFYIGYYNSQWHFENFSEGSEQVTAWKEIVPPEEE